MVRQGDIIKINFNPQAGHEQAGYRPALVVNNDFFNMKTQLAIVCPITNTNNRFPLHIPLDQQTKTTGVVLCEHVRTLDVQVRQYQFVEKIPKEILQKVIEIIFYGCIQNLGFIRF